MPLGDSDPQGSCLGHMQRSGWQFSNSEFLSWACREGSSDKLGHQFCAVMFDLLRPGNLNTSPQESKRNNLQRKGGNELFPTAEIAARKIEAGHGETLLNSKNSEELK